MPGTPSKGDAVGALSADHRAIEALFDRFGILCASGATDAEKGRAPGAICIALSVPAQSEGEFFYSSRSGAAGEAALINQVEVRSPTISRSDKRVAR